MLEKTHFFCEYPPRYNNLQVMSNRALIIIEFSNCCVYRCLLYAEMSIDIELQIKADLLNKKTAKFKLNRKKALLAYLQHHISAFLSSCDIGGLFFIIYATNHCVLLKMPNRPFKLNNFLSMRVMKREKSYES